MAYYFVSKNNIDNGDGSKDNPFKTINQAAKIAVAGDTIEVAQGIYRECVNPNNGGLGNNNRIKYINKTGETPVIVGSELIENWENIDDEIWKTAVDNKIFDDYNPFKEYIYGDWYYDLGIKHHTGEVYLNGKAMYEVTRYEDLLKPLEQGTHDYHWLKLINDAKCLELQKYKWFAQVEEEKTIIWANFQNINPNEKTTEISVRQSCFFPKKEHINYISVSGFEMKQAATQWAPPTAFQSAVIGTNWSKFWIIENCIISESKCCGISLGKRENPKDNAWSKRPTKKGAQTQTEMVFLNLSKDWNKETVGSHIVRNNTIFNCGQAGIVGHMGCVFSTIENNHIYNINIRDEFSGLEIAGIKFHCGIDVIIRNNCIHNCYRGLWLDWEAQGARVSGNSFFENTDNDLYIEVCHGPCLVDNNIFLSKTNFLNMSQGTAMVHNLFAGEIVNKKELSRFTMYHLPHSTMVLGVMRFFGGDDKAINNIYVGGKAGTDNYNNYPSICEEDKWLILDSENAMPVNICNNLYFNKSKSYEKETLAVVDNLLNLEVKVVKEDNSFYLVTNLMNSKVDFKAELVSTQTLGKAFQADANYENPDETPIFVNVDFFGKKRSKIIKGPFASLVVKAKLN